MKEKFLSAKDLLEVKKSSAIHADNFGREDKTETRRGMGANQFDRRDGSFGGNRRGHDDRVESDREYDWGRDAKSGVVIEEDVNLTVKVVLKIEKKEE